VENIDNNKIHGKEKNYRRSIAEMNWVERVHFVPRFTGYSLTSMAILIGLTLCTMLMESAGIATVLPLIEILQRGESMVSLAESSMMFRYVFFVFQFVGLDMTIGTLIIVAAGIISIRQAFHYMNLLVQAHFTSRAIEKISTETYRALVGSNVAYSETLRSGTIINALFTEAKRAATLAAAIITMASGFVKILVLMALLACVSWEATLIAVIALAVVAGAISWRYLSGSRDAGRVVNKKQDSLTRHTSDRLGLIRLIKAQGTERSEASAFAEENKTLRDGRVAVARHAAGAKVTIESVAGLGALALLYIAVNGLQLDLAVLAIFLIITFRLLPVVQEIALGRQSIAACTDSLLYIDRIRLKAEMAEEDFQNGGDFPGLRREIRFENVSFSYPPSDSTSRSVVALRDVNLAIPAGKTTALLGPSGAGKSTLIDLIPRLREPTSGGLYFDDMPVENIRLANLRSAIAIVSQDALIIDGTVVGNLRYGHPEASRMDVEAAARAAFADGFIRALPKGYDTIVGERGVLLSGGQKQRLALARALLVDVPVLLLDEPTSALDSESETAVQRALATLQQDAHTTIVIIAHRLSTVRHADYIVVLDEGRVIGTGTHEALLAKAPWYRRVVELQTGERIAAVAPDVGKREAARE
jgi:subfamily B ATP-binding cassette protein MsbA